MAAMSTNPGLMKRSVGPLMTVVLIIICNGSSSSSSSSPNSLSTVKTVWDDLIAEYHQDSDRFLENIRTDPMDHPRSLRLRSVACILDQPMIYKATEQHFGKVTATEGIHSDLELAVVLGSVNMAQCFFDHGRINAANSLAMIKELASIACCMKHDTVFRVLGNWLVHHVPFNDDNHAFHLSLGFDNYTWLYNHAVHRNLMDIKSATIPLFPGLKLKPTKKHGKKSIGTFETSAISNSKASSRVRRDTKKQMAVLEMGSMEEYHIDTSIDSLNQNCRSISADVEKFDEDSDELERIVNNFLEELEQGVDTVMRSSPLNDGENSLFDSQLIDSNQEINLDEDLDIFEAVLQRNQSDPK